MATFEELIEIITDKTLSSYRRRDAISELGQLGDKKAIPSLIETLKDDESYVRREAAKVLGELGDADAIEPLLEVLTEDESGDVRREAIIALGLIGDERAVEPLTIALEDSYLLARSVASASLQQIEERLGKTVSEDDESDATPTPSTEITAEETIVPPAEEETTQTPIVLEQKPPQSGVPTKPKREEKSVSMKANSPMVGTVCRVCNSPISLAQDVRKCAYCETVHHAECWVKNEGCANPNCAEDAEKCSLCGELLLITADSCPECGMNKEKISACRLCVSFQSLDNFCTVKQVKVEGAPGETNPCEGEEFNLADETELTARGIRRITSDSLTSGVKYVCSECNTELEVNYCPRCGQTVERTITVEERHEEEGKIPEDTKKCPWCGERIKKDALKCRFCGEYIDLSVREQQRPKGVVKDASSALIFALVGIFCFGIVLGPIAIFKGIKAINTINFDPNYKGKGRAIAAIILGSLEVLLWVLGIIGRLATL